MTEEEKMEFDRLTKNEEHFHEIAGHYQTAYRKLVEELIMIKEYIEKLTYGLRPICRDMETKHLGKIKNEKN